MFMHAYISPSKWYRREFAWRFKIVLWPGWLARKICTHAVIYEYRKADPESAFMCTDCGALIYGPLCPLASILTEEETK